MNCYKVLNNQKFSLGEYSIVPIRYEDRFDIMKWRNEQIYHLRQNKPLTKEDQEFYFKNIVSNLFGQEKPNQVLFSFLRDDILVGYGGLVHINWVDKNAEISFVMKTSLEKKYFHDFWLKFLYLVEQVAFNDLKFHNIYTYAFDIRPNLYLALKDAEFFNEAVLKEHCCFNNQYIDVLIHTKINKYLNLRSADVKDLELLFKWANDYDVRKNAINSSPISWESHIIWFQNKINDKFSKIFILTYHDNPIGQIRIDFVQNRWVIDYSIDLAYRGKGFGEKMIKLLIVKFKSFRYKAIVRIENKASIRVFEKLGFTKTNSNNPDYLSFEN